MRFYPTLLGVAIAVASLAACSGGELQTGRSALSSSVRPAIPVTTPNPGVLWQQSLFVADNGYSKIRLFADGTWSANGSFSNGVSYYPTGLWSDQKYLYVANVTNVEEYRPNHPVPIFTYTNGLADGISNVTTQVLGNVHYVFVTGGGDGFVKQFQRDTNTVLATTRLPTRLPKASPLTLVATCS
ncbi:MAG TPA: hypothetical protein VHT92_06135 [Candidatus Cybelea sp.]|nr:hypothetical protein [Candidatus Cybelea sp.]